MKRLFSLLVSGLMALSTWAIPANPATFTVQQSDGTILTLRMVGDEFHHYYLNVTTGQKMLQGEDGDYYVVPETQLQSMATYGIQQRSFVNAQREQRLATLSNSTAATATVGGPARFPGKFNSGLKGEKHGLVLLVNFSDKKFQDGAEAFYERFFNEEGFADNSAIGSVHDYFKEQSYGIFQPKFDIIGPIDLPQNMAYYGTNHPQHSSDKRAAEMLYHGVQLAKEQIGSDLDFSRYDWDNDGEVDLVFIIYAGYAESNNAPSTTVWPHAYRMSWARQKLGADCKPLTYDGVKIDGYACAQELTSTMGTRKVGIGVACHEFSHCIGYPDFYDITGGDGFGFNNFDVMEGGAYNGPVKNACDVPCGYSAYERWMAGWLTPTELTNGFTVNRLADIGTNPEAYIIYNDANRNEYFLLENRTAERWLQYSGTAICNSGLFVSHIDYDHAAWSENQPNTDALHRRATYVPANRRYATDAASVKGSFFPGSTNATSITDEVYGTYGLRLYNRNTAGNYNLSAPITNIALAADGTVSFQFKDGTDTGERFTVTLDAGTGKCDVPSWTQGKRGETLALPTATVNLENWHFLGWNTESVSDSETRPADLLTAGTEYKPTADVTLYAVYGYSDGEVAGNDFVKAETIVSGKQYVFANKGAKATVALYAIDADALTSSYKASATGKTVVIDFSQNPPVVTDPDASVVWTAQSKGDGFTLEHNGRFLALSANGFALTGNPTTFTLHNNWGLATTVNGTNYYVQSGKGAFSVQSGNGSTTARCFPYQKVEAGDIASRYDTHPTGTPIDDPEAAITTLTTGSADAPCYDLQGRRIHPAYGSKGVYIKEGRRIIR